MKKKRVVFIGIHFKKDTPALCNSTKSGKLIQRIIDQLEEFECIKTNLYPTDYYPEPYNVRDALAHDWVIRNNIDIENDLLVPLGNHVHRQIMRFAYSPKRPGIAIYHPSSRKSHKQQDEYVIQAVKRIKETLNKIGKAYWCFTR